MMKKKLIGWIKIDEFESIVTTVITENWRSSYSSFCIRKSQNRYFIKVTYNGNDIPPLHLLDKGKFSGILSNPPYFTIWTEGIREFKVMDRELSAKLISK